jgi:hypothetical protein
MSADKFVNKVQQKMDELRLSPNPQVWVEVERRIREKKKRRVIIFWFLFGGLLLAGGGYFVFNQPGNKKESITINHKPVSTKTENTTIDKSPEENKKNDVVVIKDETEKTKQEVVSVEKEKTAQPERTVQPKQKGQNKKTTKTKQPGNSDGVTRKQNDITVIKSSPDLKNDKQAAIKANDDAAISKQPEITKTDNSGIIELPVEIKDVAIEKPKEDLEKPTEEKNDKADTVAKNDLAVEEIAKESKRKNDSTRKNKWEIGLNGALGSTRLTKGHFLDIGGAKSADALSGPNTSTGPPGAPISYADSIPLKGGYWQFGVYAKRKIDKRIYFSTGLNIASYTTKQRVGEFVDSVRIINNTVRSQTSNGFYRAGQSSVFKNRYYYIQVPLLIQWQLNKGEKIPIAWENGFVPSFLISSNALSYDRNPPRFFKDKKLYNDFNLVYHTGLSARLFMENKHPLSIGVFYNYHISMLQKVSPPNYNYLSSFGIKMNWVIKK